MTSSEEQGPATYELTVVGALGPVLRSALAPYASARAEHETILRAAVGEDSDLVDLVLMLASRGLEINGIANVS